MKTDILKLNTENQMNGAAAQNACYTKSPKTEHKLV